MLTAVRNSYPRGLFIRQTSSTFAMSAQQWIRRLQDQQKPIVTKKMLTRDNCSYFLHQHSTTRCSLYIHQLSFLMPSRLISHHIPRTLLSPTLAFRVRFQDPALISWRSPTWWTDCVLFTHESGPNRRRQVLLLAFALLSTERWKCDRRCHRMRGLDEKASC